MRLTPQKQLKHAKYLYILRNKNDALKSSFLIQLFIFVY